MASLNEAVRQYVTARRDKAPLSIRAAADAISEDFPVEHVVSRRELAEMIEDVALLNRIPVQSEHPH